MSFKVKPEPDYLTIGDTASSGSPGVVAGITTTINNQGQVALGFDALKSRPTETTSDVAIGFKAGENSLGQYFLAIGQRALSEMRSSTYNIGIGFSTGRYVEGSNNTLLGNNTGFFLKGDYNIAIGESAGQGSSLDSQTVTQSCILIGRNAGQKSAISKDGMIAIGNNAMHDFGYLGTTVGGSLVDSIAIGTDAMYSAGTTRSIAIGAESSYYVRGGDNVAIGYQSLKGSVGGSAYNTASSNVAIGSYASYQTHLAQYNVAIGYGALAGADTGFQQRELSGNVAIGFNAGQAGSWGSNNVYIGINAGLTGQYNNVIVIGAGATQSASSNEITLGNVNIGTLRCQVTSITSLSDERDKSDIEDIDYGLNVINNLKPVKFTWNMRSGGKTGIRDIGFTAQDLMTLEDELNAHDELRLTYRVNPDALEASYGRLIPVLVKAIQELSAEVELLKTAA